MVRQNGGPAASIAANAPCSQVWPAYHRVFRQPLHSTRYGGQEGVASTAGNDHCCRTRTDDTQSFKPRSSQSCCGTNCKLDMSSVISSESSR